MAQAGYYKDIERTIGEFTTGDCWRLYRYRMAIYEKDVQGQVNTAIRKGESGKAQRLLGKLDGIEDLLQITERFGKEVSRLDADVAFNVIEKNKRGA